MPKLTRGLLALALVPSAWLAWQFRDLPQLGIYHDDGIYLVTAASLAEGNGYRIASLPGEPYQTKYPPLFPVVVSAVWRLAPQFPASLPWFALLLWLLLPAVVWLTRRLLLDSGFNPVESAGLAAFVALSPVAVMFSTLMMSELMFLALLLGTFILAQRGKPGWAGLVGAAAFLTRSAGLPLLVSAPLVYALRRQWRSAAAFHTCMAPAVIAWQIWSASSRAPDDPLTLFYTNYFGYWAADMRDTAWGELLEFNLFAAVKAVGELVVFDEDITLGTVTLARLIFFGAIVGAWRLGRQGRLRHYSVFAAFYFVQFLVWNYPPTNRFLLPLLPLVAAALYTELRKLSGIVREAYRKPKPSDRASAVAAAVLLVWCAWLPVKYAHYGIARFLPAAYGQCRTVLHRERPAQEWLRTHGGGGPVLSYRDPLVYLHTGRKSVSVRVPPSLIRRGDKTAIERFFTRLPAEIARAGIGHILHSEADYQMDAPALTRPAYAAAIQRSGAATLAHGGGNHAVYQVRQIRNATTSAKAPSALYSSLRQ